jgi:lipopolysaccharide assembly outer membrane protein LptD (OstA)
MKHLAFLFALLMLVGACAFRAYSQAPAKPNGKATPALSSPQDKTLIIKKAVNVTRQKVGGRFVTTLVGHVRLEIPDDNLTLEADRVEYDEEALTAKATGKVRLLRGEEIVLNGETLNANFDENKAVFTGGVRLVYKSKTPSAEQQLPSDASKQSKADVKTTTLTCERLEYDLDEKMAVATGKLQVVYDTGSATAEKAILMEEDKLVTLEGKVSITSEGENKAAFTLDKATVNIETSKLDGDNPTGTFSLKRKKP